MSRALTFIVSIALVFAIAIGNGVRAQEAPAQRVPTGAEYLAAQGAEDLMRERLRTADLINQVAALKAKTVELQGQIDKRKQEDDEAAKTKTP